MNSKTLSVNNPLVQTIDDDEIENITSKDLDSKHIGLNKKI